MAAFNPHSSFTFLGLDTPEEKAYICFACLVLFEFNYTQRVGGAPPTNNDMASFNLQNALHPDAKHIIHQHVIGNDAIVNNSFSAISNRITSINLYDCSTEKNAFKSIFSEKSTKNSYQKLQNYIAKHIVPRLQYSKGNHTFLTGNTNQQETTGLLDEVNAVMNQGFFDFCQQWQSTNARPSFPDFESNLNSYCKQIRQKLKKEPSESGCMIS